MSHQAMPQPNSTLARGCSDSFRTCGDLCNVTLEKIAAKLCTNRPKYPPRGSTHPVPPRLNSFSTTQPAAMLSSEPKSRGSGRFWRHPTQMSAEPSNAQDAAFQRASSAKGTASVKNTTPNAMKDSIRSFCEPDARRVKA